MKEALLKFADEIVMDANGNTDKSGGPLSEVYLSITKQLREFDEGSDVRKDLKKMGKKKRQFQKISTWFSNLAAKRKREAKKAAEAPSPQRRSPRRNAALLAAEE